jgi:beta-xylosidase
MHWDGSNWSVVPSPEPANDQIYLNDVHAISANDAWAVGYFTSLEFGGDLPLLIHWDGTAWSMVERDWGVAPDFLTAVTAVSGTDVWAAGYNYTDGVFFLRYSDPCAP